MTVTLTYDSIISRIRISANGLLGTDTATVDRSTDGIRWTTVRGAASVGVVGDDLAVPVDDFEFPTGVPVTYRVQGVGSLHPAFVSVGAADTGADGSRTPPMPAGIVSGDLLLIETSTRNTDVGVPDTPPGWAHLAGFGNLRVYGRVWNGVFGSPTVTFTDGATNEDTIAQMAAFRNVALSPASGVVQNNLTPHQDIPFRGHDDPLPEQGMLVVYMGWKGDVWTSVANIAAGYTVEIDEVTSSAGNGSGQVWDYYLAPSQAPINNGSFVVTGGVSAPSRGGTLVLPRTNTTSPQTASITPVVGEVWLKSISRPFLNRPVDTRFASSITVSRKARAATFDVIGRSLPVAVSSVRGPREWTMLVRTETAEDRDNTDLLLASGDVLLVQAPPDSGVETGYVSVGDVAREAHPLRPLSNLFTLPLIEVAAPDAEVVGAVGTWQTVATKYATWSDVITDNATWADLLSIVGEPSEVIVP